jgi:hypothetical protein
MYVDTAHVSNSRSNCKVRREQSFIFRTVSGVRGTDQYVESHEDSVPVWSMDVCPRFFVFPVNSWPIFYDGVISHIEIRANCVKRKHTWLEETNVRCGCNTVNFQFYVVAFWCIHHCWFYLSTVTNVTLTQDIGQTTQQKKHEHYNDVDQHLLKLN